MASMRLVFPLGVVAVDDIDGGREIHIQCGIVPEVVQGQVMDDH